MKKTIAAALAAASTLATVSADAATFDYRFAFAYQNASEVVSGTLTATETAPGAYTIDGATGLFTEEYLPDDGSVEVYENGAVQGVDMSFSGLGPSFTLTGGTLTSFFATFTGTNGFSDLSYTVDYLGGAGTGFFVEIGGPLTEASVTAGSTVPEPATWGLMMLGFGAIGGAMRRRQKTSATVRFA
jgi:hypothetical protein